MSTSAWSVFSVKACSMTWIPGDSLIGHCVGCSASHVDAERREAPAALALAPTSAWG